MGAIARKATIVLLAVGVGFIPLQALSANNNNNDNGSKKSSRSEKKSRRQSRERRPGPIISNQEEFARAQRIVSPPPELPPFDLERYRTPTPYAGSYFWPSSRLTGVYGPPYSQYVSPDYSAVNNFIGASDPWVSPYSYTPPSGAGGATAQVSGGGGAGYAETGAQQQIAGYGPERFHTPLFYSAGSYAPNYGTQGNFGQYFTPAPAITGGYLYSGNYNYTLGYNAMGSYTAPGYYAGPNLTAINSIVGPYGVPPGYPYVLNYMGARPPTFGTKTSPGM